MRTRTKLLAAGFAAAMLMALAVGTASATHISTSSQSFKATWTNLNFSSAGFFNIECPVTLEGSFHSATIAKAERALIGYVNRASVNSASCTGGHATILQETLPWHIEYMGFLGTLPRITGIKVLLKEASFTISTSGITCLAHSEVNNPADGIIQREAGGRVTGLQADETVPIPTTGFFCPSTGTFRNTGAVTEPPRGVAITVTLI